MSERHFYRCLNCCVVFALDGPRQFPWCDCGGGPWGKETHPRSSVEWMGKVAGNHVVRIEDRCPCDSRCTHAVGFHCDCVCNGANHGTHAVVKTVTNFQGVPKIVTTDLQDRMIAVAEFEELAAEAQKVIDADPMVIAIRKREWIKDYAAWKKGNELMGAIRRARKLKTMAGRMKALAKIINVKEAA